MKARLINFPATTLDAAEALGVDVERFCIESLRRLVESMERRAIVAPKQEKQPVPRRGRPPKGAGREPISLHLEPDSKAAIDALAVKRGISRSDALDLIIRAAKAAGLINRLLVEELPVTK